ncbi:glycosyltransferase family 2 protein [Winogradskyella aurantiaca]|uniref:glycosyltransferase family 2 protein n=1 Tax=Winogradskyella aurantiaca TaxID=2219558 RepID=UPI000E1CD446|nr:glycosyltransferase family 2 protein [Winogradskyella aurantiaca]
MVRLPLVSVVCTVYNNEKYLRQCLESLVTQNCTFDYEIIVHDDCSTDSSQEIIREFENNYPEFIRPIYQPKNIYSQNIKPWPICFEKARGKFIAICEGDDYWTAPYKLQKQVSFLTKNPEFGICGHNVKELNSFNGKQRILPGINEYMTYSIIDYVDRNYTATCSIVFRKNCLNLPHPLFKYSPFGDWAISLLIMDKSNGKIHVLDDEMGCYRIHADGSHGRFHRNRNSLVHAYRLHLIFIRTVKKYLLTQKVYERPINKKLRDTNRLISSIYPVYSFQSIKYKIYSKLYHIKMFLKI